MGDPRGLGPCVRVLSRADHVTTPTPTAARLLSAHGLTTPITAISCGVDLHRFRAVDHGRRVPGLFGLPDRPTIAFVGRLDPDKHLDELVAALPHVHAGLDAQLVIAGVGRHRDTLRGRAVELGVGDRVHMPGARARRVAAPGSTPPRTGSPCPAEPSCRAWPPLEALASGKSVVAANATALPPLVRPGFNGLLYPPGSVTGLAAALRTVLENPTLLARFARSARLTAEEHPHTATTRCYEQLYQSLIAAGRARTRP